MGLKKLLVERILHDTIDQAREYLISNNIDLEDTDLEYYIGSGAFGDVYKVKDKNKVVKFFEDMEGYELKKYQKLVDQDNLENVCNVHFVRRTSGESNIYIAVLDYLEEHSLFQSKNEKREFSAFISHFEPSYLDHVEDQITLETKFYIKKFLSIYLRVDDGNTKEDGKRLLEELGKHYGDDREFMNIILYILTEFVLMYESGNAMNTEMIIKGLTEQPQFFKDIFNGVKEYKEMGVPHGDVHIFNVLYDTKRNKYKLIDPM